MSQSETKTAEKWIIQYQTPIPDDWSNWMTCIHEADGLELLKSVQSHYPQDVFRLVHVTESVRVIA